MCKILIFLALLALSVNAKSHKKNREKDEDTCTRVAARECDRSKHNYHCKNDEDESVTLCIGDTVTISFCRQMTCVHHDGDMVLINGCRDQELKPGCRWEDGNSTLPYPLCCRQQVCA